MCDHAAQSDRGTDQTGRQSMHKYQKNAAWMSHWKPSIKSHNDLPLLNGFKDDPSDIKQHASHCGPRKATDVSQEFREFSEARRDDIIDKNLKMSAMKLGKGRLDSKPSPLLSSSWNQESGVELNNNWVISSPKKVKYQLYPKNGNDNPALGRSKWAQFPEIECNSLQPEGVLWDPKHLVNSHGFLEKNSLAVSTSFQLDVGSNSKIVPPGFNSEGAEMQSFMCQQEETDQSAAVAASKEHSTDAKYCNHSTFWVHEKQIHTTMESRKLETSLSKWNHSPSLLASRGNHPEVMKSVKGYHKYSSLPKIPSSVLDVETMRIHTTIGSMEELPSRPPTFSQTTHGFFITKKTDVNLSSSCQVFKDSKVSSRLKGKTYRDFLTLSPSFSFEGRQDVNLQPEPSSTESKERENAGNVKTSAVCLQNESSAKTDAMELNFFQKSHHSGVPLCLPNQKIEGPQNSSTSRMSIGSAREETVERTVNTNTELPDINQKPFNVPVVASLADDRETSPLESRTLSLDTEHLLFHAEQPTNSKSTACPNAPLGAELGSRSVKRLRLGRSDSSDLGTKRSKTGEASSQEHGNEIFSNILKCSMTCSGPSLGKCHVKPQMALDHTVMLLKNGDSRSTDSARKSQDITLSNSWIQRWTKIRTASPRGKPKIMVLCEPKSSKAALIEYQKKQFPSIAAMALMGKAMRGNHPCEFKRRGSLMVWNT